MSKNSNRIKNELLGMPHGTANGKLRKIIIFWLANICKMLTCFKCGKQIEDIDDLSIEHKIPWQSAIKPKDVFLTLIILHLVILNVIDQIIQKEHLE